MEVGLHDTQGFDSVLLRKLQTSRLAGARAVENGEGPSRKGGRLGRVRFVQSSGPEYSNIDANSTLPALSAFYSAL